MHPSPLSHTVWPLLLQAAGGAHAAAGGLPPLGHAPRQQAAAAHPAPRLLRRPLPHRSSPQAVPRLLVLWPEPLGFPSGAYLLWGLAVDAATQKKIILASQLNRTHSLADRNQASKVPEVLLQYAPATVRNTSSWPKNCLQDTNYLGFLPARTVNLSRHVCAARLHATPPRRGAGLLLAPKQP